MPSPTPRRKLPAGPETTWFDWGMWAEQREEGDMNEFDGTKRIAVDVDPAPEDEEPEGAADALAELDALLAEMERNVTILAQHIDEALLAEIGADATRARTIVTRMRGGAA